MKVGNITHTAHSTIFSFGKSAKRLLDAWLSAIVAPAEAGTQRHDLALNEALVDSGLRRNDDEGASHLAYNYDTKMRLPRRHVDAIRCGGYNLDNP